MKGLLVIYFLFTDLVSLYMYMTKRLHRFNEILQYNEIFTLLQLSYVHDL